jgi:hypothetical protein
MRQMGTGRVADEHAGRSERCSSVSLPLYDGQVEICLMLEG